MFMGWSHNDLHSLCDKIVVSKIEKLICNVSGKENIL